MSTCCTKKTIACITQFFAAIFAICCLFVSPALATEINVTTTADELANNEACSLREAVINANENFAVWTDCPAGQPGALAVDVIKLSDGVYPLTRCLGVGDREIDAQYSSDDAGCDDLDIYDDLIVQGASTDGTIIEIGEAVDVDSSEYHYPNAQDSRIFDIHGGEFFENNEAEAQDFLCEVQYSYCEVAITFEANDLTLRKGNDYDGGALFAHPSGPCGGIPDVTLRRVKAHDNEAPYCGGAISVHGNLTIEDSTIENNASAYSGGGVCVRGIAECTETQVRISGTSISNNRADHGDGGGIHFFATNALIENGSTIDNNGAYYVGGGIANYATDLVIRDSSVSGNHGVDYSGPQSADDDDDDDEDDDDDNDGPEWGYGPYEGGGIYNSFFNGNVAPGEDDEDDNEGEEAGSVLIEDSQINNNQASVQGAGISNGHAIFGCLVDSGLDVATACNVNPDINAQEIAPLGAGGFFTVRGSEVNGNKVTGDIFNDFDPTTLQGIYLPMGGGIHHGPLAGVFNLEGSTVAENVALFGGGIMNRWIMNISASTISSNIATFPEEYFFIDGARIPGVSEDDEAHLLSLFIAGGGGIFNAAVLDVTNSTISSNETIGSGAGLFNITGPIYYLIWAAVNGHLSDLDSEDELTLLPNPGAILKNVTVTANEITEAALPEQPAPSDFIDGISFVGNGGGIATFTGEVTLRNTIVAGNIDELENFNWYFDGFDANVVPTGSPSGSPSETPTSTPTGSPSATPTATPTPEFENPFEAQPDYAPDCYAFPDILGQLCYGLVSDSDIFDVCEGLVPNISSQQYNIIGDNTGCFPFQPAGDFPLDKVGTEELPIDPVLGPLADNGGPTLTHLLLLGSPAIDMGNPEGAIGSSDEDAESFACEDDDQRGIARPLDGDVDGEARCDIGAVEVEVDCAGDPSGNAILDECGICDGDGTSCADCAGTPNGDAIFDECDVCNGDGLSCKEVACEEVDITQTLFSMDGTSDQHAKMARSLVRKLGKLTGRKGIAKKLLAQAKELYIANWTSTWSIPSILQTNCEGAQSCVQVNNVGTLGIFNANSEGIHTIVKKLIRKLKRAGLSKGKIKKLTNRNEALLAKALEASGNVPATFEQCS